MAFLCLSPSGSFSSARKKAKDLAPELKAARERGWERGRVQGRSRNLVKLLQENFADSMAAIAMAEGQPRQVEQAALAIAQWRDQNKGDLKRVTRKVNWIAKWWSRRQTEWIVKTYPGNAPKEGAAKEEKKKLLAELFLLS